MKKRRSRIKKAKEIFSGIYNWVRYQLTFQKLLVIFLVVKGVGWVDQSYELAWAGHTEIASDLSQKALTELLGVVLLYSVKALFENISKNNTWPDKPSESVSDEETKG